MKSSLRLALAASISLLSLVEGCQNQSEGERCDSRNDNADCEDGLACKIIQGQAFQACCPPVGASKAPACNASSVPTNTADAASDGASDAASEAETTEEIDAASEAGPEEAGSEEAGTEAAAR